MTKMWCARCRDATEHVYEKQWEQWACKVCGFNPTKERKLKEAEQRKAKKEK